MSETPKRKRGRPASPTGVSLGKAEHDLLAEMSTRLRLPKSEVERCALRMYYRDSTVQAEMLAMDEITGWKPKLKIVDSE